MIVVVVLVVVVIVVVVLVVIVVVFVFVAMPVGVGAGRKPVVRVEAADRDADRATIAEEPREAEATALGHEIRVRDHPEGVLFLMFVVVVVVILVVVVVVIVVVILVVVVLVVVVLVVVVIVVIVVVIVVLLFDLGVAWDLVGIGLPADGAQVPGPIAAAAVEVNGAHALVGHGSAPKVYRAFECADGPLGRNPSVDHVDRAADGLRTEAERGGAAENLDLLGVRRLEGHGVVGADDGGVAGVDSVLHDAHPAAGQAANDRPAGAGDERRRVHAGFVLQRLAQGGAEAQLEVRAGQHGDGIRQLGRGAQVAGRGDHNLVEVRSVTHLELNFGLVAAGDGDRVACRAECGNLDDDEIGAGRHLVEAERAVRGHRGADAECGDACHGEHDSLAVGVDGAGDRAGFLGGRGRGDEKQGKGAENRARHLAPTPRVRVQGLGVVSEHGLEFLGRSVRVEGVVALAAGIRGGGSAPSRRRRDAGALVGSAKADRVVAIVPGEGTVPTPRAQRGSESCRFNRSAARAPFPASVRQCLGRAGDRILTRPGRGRVRRLSSCHPRRSWCGPACRRRRNGRAAPWPGLAWCRRRCRRLSPRGRPRSRRRSSRPCRDHGHSPPRLQRAGWRSSARER